MTRLRSPKGLSGPDGVIASVIKLAYQDTLHPPNNATKADALRYLRSELYQSDLRFLGYPDTARPKWE